MRAKGLVMEGFAVTAGPVELATDILDRLGDARVSSQAMVMVGAQDI